MSIETLLIIAVALLVVLTVALIFNTRQSGLQARLLHDELIRLQSELSSQGEQSDRLRKDVFAIHHTLERRLTDLQSRQTDTLAANRIQHNRALNELSRRIGAALENHQTRFERRQGEAIQSLQDGLRTGMGDVSGQVTGALEKSATQLGSQLDKLTATTSERLKEISAQVDERLDKGFARTTETFSRVLEHLSRIDEAQKRITELSSNVVSLQEVLTDKRSRGAFGEVQLNGLVRNLLPEHSFALQHVLSNQSRVDCMLFLPEPSGNLAVDAKFPLESFQRMMDIDLSDGERKQASLQFKQDIRKHIQDIAGKYIIPGETADGAIMFLPAEAVFAEIHAHFPDLVQMAQQRKVWMVSPTTLMAILTTARAVLKDEATRKQVHIIQQHLQKLSKDFGRFRTRMDSLGRHIKQAGNDVDDISTSARKISHHFDRIEQVELDQEALQNAPGPAVSELGQQ